MGRDDAREEGRGLIVQDDCTKGFAQLSSSPVAS